MAMKKPFVALLACLLATAVAWGSSITGRVTSRGEPAGEALIGATVLVKGTVRGATTNTQGEFRIPNILPGRYTLVVSMVGYNRETLPNVVVDEGKDTHVSVVLSAATVQMDQVVVTASRRQQSLEEVPVSLSVLDATQIAERNSLSLEDALRYIPGVNLTGFQVNIRGSSGYSRGAGSRVLMLLDDAAIHQRHRPAGEIHHLGPELDVHIMQGRLVQCDTASERKTRLGRHNNRWG